MLGRQEEKKSCKCRHDWIQEKIKEKTINSSQLYNWWWCFDLTIYSSNLLDFN
jgi:hypothetical protein